MLETAVYDYYAFGYNYNLLRNYKVGRPIHGTNLDSLESSMRQFFRKLNELDLRVTEKAADPLMDIVLEALDQPEGATVDDALAGRIREAIERMDATLDAELKLTSAYILTRKRFATPDLIKTPGNLLGTGMYELLPEISQFDFASGCRCVALEQPTAAAFHLMRAVEGVLRFYYCKVVKRGRVKKQMWHEVVQHLGRRNDAPPRTLLDSLDNIRANFRNPTQHPEARYNLDEAQDLLALSAEVINRMVRDLGQRALVTLPDAG